MTTTGAHTRDERQSSEPLRWLRALVFVACALSGGCQESRTDALRFALASDPVTLDPRFATDATSQRINRLLYQSLVDFDEHFQPAPALATWEQLESVRYRFMLDPGARFHNGQAVTAGDVKATYESVLAAQTGSPHRGSLSNIENIEQRDAHTLDFVLAKPDPLFPGRLVLGVMPARLLAGEHPFNRAPLGSGPFRLSEWVEEGVLKLVRVVDGQAVDFERVANPTVRVLKLLRGEVDMLQGNLPPELIEWLEEREEVAVKTVEGTSFAYLGLNMEDEVLRNPAVRRALALALDREAIIRYVLGGAARPAAALLTAAHWAGHPRLSPLPYDPQRALELLTTAGYSKDQPLNLVYKTSSDPFRVRLATVIQDQLAEVGIQVSLRTYDWGTFYGDVKAGNFQMFSLAWVGVKMPDIFRYVFHSEAVPPNGANRGRYASALADQLIEAAERATDLERQRALYRKLQEHLLEELPYVPLWYEDQVFISRADIEGYTLVQDGNYDGLNSAKRVRATVE